MCNEQSFAAERRKSAEPEGAVATESVGWICLVRLGLTDSHIIQAGQIGFVSG